MNSFELERDDLAAPALRRMKEILDAPAPYKMVHEAEGLIGTVSKVNTAMVTQRRSEAVAKIDGLISEMTKELDSAQGDGGLRYSCLSPLESLHEQVEGIDSIAHLTQAEQKTMQAFDEAMGKVEEFVKKPVKEPGIEDPPAKKPKLKPRCIVKPADLADTTYLETPEDIDRFLDELRKRLETAISSGRRVQIR